MWFIIGDARHFKFGLQIDNDNYKPCVIDYPKRGCVQGHVIYLNFGK